MGYIDDRDHIVPIDIIFPYFPTVDMLINGEDEFPGMIDTGLHYAFVFPVSWIANLAAEQRSELIPADGYFSRSLSFSTGVMLADKEEKLQITGVWQGSPAAKAGLSPELELVAIEGGKYGEITNRELSMIMLDPDIKEITLTVYKDGIRQEIQLQKRELFN